MTAGQCLLLCLSIILPAAVETWRPGLQIQDRVHHVQQEQQNPPSRVALAETCLIQFCDAPGFSFL